MSSVYRQTLGSFAFQRQPVRVDIPRGVNIHAIEGRVTGAVTITGGTGTGTAFSDGVQRSISQLRIRHDGDDRISGLDGRRLYQLTARDRLTITAASNLADSTAQAATPVAFDFLVSLARPQLAQPVLTAWPATLPVRTELAVYIEWNTATAAGASDVGTGAFVQGGDQAGVTFSTPLTVELVLVYSLGAIQPWALTRMRSDTSQQFAVANSQLPYLLNGNRRIIQLLHRMLQGSNAEAQEGVNNLSIQASGGASNLYGTVNYTMLQRDDAGIYPAAEEAGQTGVLFQNFANNGLLSTILDPRPWSNPRVLYDVDAPTGSPGVIDVTLVEADIYPGITQWQN